MRQESEGRPGKRGRALPLPCTPPAAADDEAAAAVINTPSPVRHAGNDGVSAAAAPALVTPVALLLITPTTETETGVAALAPPVVLTIRVSHIRFFQLFAMKRIKVLFGEYSL